MESGASGALMTDPEVKAPRDQVMGMPEDEFQAEFADLIYAGARDEGQKPGGCRAWRQTG